LIGAGFSISSEITLDNLVNLPDFSKYTQNLNFDNMEVVKSSPGVIKTKSYFKLSYKSDLEFSEDYFSKISGLICLDKDRDCAETFKISKYDLDREKDPSIKKAYDDVYEDSKFILSSSGHNLNSLVKIYKDYPENPFGILLTENSDYKIFQKFIREYLLSSQNFDINQHDHIHKPDEYKNFIPIKNSESKKLLSSSVCLIRNIIGYPYVASKFNKNLEVHELFKKTLDHMNIKHPVGKYYPIQEDTLKMLSDNNLNLQHFDNPDFMSKSEIQKDFPDNRGVIHFEKDNIFAIINDIDHLKLMINVKDEKLHTHFMNILKLSNEFSKVLKFVYDKRLGFLTTSPKYVGTGMIIKTNIKLEHLIKNSEKLNSIISPYDFKYTITDEAQGVVQICNKYTIGRSETDLLMSLIHLINELIDKDVE
jgi:protein-arginine kinase